MVLTVSKEVLTPILTHSREALDGATAAAPRRHLVRVGGDGILNPAGVERVLAMLRGTRGLHEVIDPEVLEIAQEPARLVARVAGIPAITRYCNAGIDGLSALQPETYSWLQRTTVVSDPFPEIFQIPLESRVVEEAPANPENADALLDAWDKGLKTFRLIKAFRYVGGGGARAATAPSFRIEMIRETTEPALTMTAAGLTARPVAYAMFIEYPAVAPAPTAAADPRAFLEPCVQILQAYTGTAHLLDNESVAEVLHQYDVLVRKVLPGAGNAEHFFLAPKPITLERQNLLDPARHYGVVSIQDSYAVSEKADGERMLLFIDGEGRAFLINNTFAVVDTGMRTTAERLRRSLLDGEFVPAARRRDGAVRDLFAAFDIYFIGGESVMDLPLMDSGAGSGAARAGSGARNDLMVSAMAPGVWEGAGAAAAGTVELRAKVHRHGGDIFQKTAEILEGHRTFPYEIDGVIFTPTRLSVFGVYPGRTIPVSHSVRWSRVFKWKPPEQNTIDFYVEYGAVRIDDLTGKAHRELILHTGYNASQWEHISVYQGLKIRYDKAFARQYYDAVRAKGEDYRFKRFVPISYNRPGVDIALVEIPRPRRNGGAPETPRAADGSLIENRSIVECSYQPATGQWRILRAREDKTRLLRTGQISKTANDLTVAANIWRTIHNEVSTAMIMGRVPAAGAEAATDLEERQLGVDDLYYARDIQVRHMLSTNMLYFHTHGIKKPLYQLSRRRDALLELACGMAGDLPRWRDCGYRFVLGVDSVRDNITNPRNGSYAQMLRQKRTVAILDEAAGVERTIYPDHVFVVGDCSLPLRDGSAAAAGTAEDRESQRILQLLFRASAAPPAPHLRYLAGKAAKGFNVVSCQFAIHYFMENAEKLNGFLANVAGNLVSGGIFIATFMNGARVHQLFESRGVVARGGSVVGAKSTSPDDAAVPVWALVRYYDEGQAADAFGQRVGVFLEITRKIIPEFLVSIPLLEHHAAAHGLRLETVGHFEERFQELLAAVPADPAAHTQLDKAILGLQDDEIQRQFSFLNCWVVFRKA